MSHPVLSSAGEFRLDVDLARAALARLEEVRDRLRGLRRDATTLARATVDTAHDPVSKEAFQLLRERADGPPGSLGVALGEGIEHVNGLIRQLQSDIAEQEETDAAAANRLERS